MYHLEPSPPPQSSGLSVVIKLRRALLTGLAIGLFALPMALARVEDTSRWNFVQAAPSTPTETLPYQQAAAAFVETTVSPPVETIADYPADTPVEIRSSFRLPEEMALEGGTLFLSMKEAGYSRLFAYHPQLLPLTRLTNGRWDDIQPAISPDSSRLAFASNREGVWDLYVLDLQSGQVQRVTNTPDYDASPAWSPDGKWMAFESYSSEKPEGLDIYIYKIGGKAAPIRLTDHPGADYAPAWSPRGRQVAFVSDRSGEKEIWLADLDRTDERFINTSFSADSEDEYPAWSPDGAWLAWTSQANGSREIYLLDMGRPRSQAQPQLAGEGSQPVWSPSGKFLVTPYLTANKTYLTGYAAGAADLLLPPLLMAGALDGLAWGW